MEKLIIESRNFLDESTFIRVSKKSKEFIDEIAKRSGRSQRIVADRMIAFAYEHVVIEGEEDDKLDEYSREEA